MICHDYPCVNDESFVLNAVFKAVEHNMAVLISGKNINPAYDGEGNKVGSFGGVKFVLIAHEANIGLMFFIEDHVRNLKHKSLRTGFASDLRYSYIVIDKQTVVPIASAIVYPNSTSDLLHVRTAVKNAVFELYDLSGKKLKSKSLANLITPVNIENIVEGTYVWSVVQQNNLIETGKIIKANKK
jgi:hypothetical protein